MNGYLPPGWNLPGRLPSISGLKSAHGYVAIGGNVPTSFAGKLLRVPQSVRLTTEMLGQNYLGTTYQVQAGDEVSDTTIPAYHLGQMDIAAISAAISAAITRAQAALPALFINGSGAYTAGILAPYESPPAGVPVIGGDFIQVYCGIPSAINQAAVLATIPNMVAYSVLIFLQDSFSEADVTASGAQATIDAWNDAIDAITDITGGDDTMLIRAPGFESLTAAGTVKDSIQTTIDTIQGYMESGPVTGESEDAFTTAVGEAAAAGIDISIVGSASEVDADAICAIVSDHYGVTI